MLPVLPFYTILVVFRGNAEVTTRTLVLYSIATKHRSTVSGDSFPFTIYTATGLWLYLFTWSCIFILEFFFLKKNATDTRLLLLSCRAQQASNASIHTPTVLCRWYCLLCCTYVNKLMHSVSDWPPTYDDSFRFRRKQNNRRQGPINISFITRIYDYDYYYYYYDNDTDNPDELGGWFREAFAWVLCSSSHLFVDGACRRKKKKKPRSTPAWKGECCCSWRLFFALRFIISFHRPGDGMGDHHHHHHHVHVDSLRWWLVTGGTKVSFYGLRIKLCRLDSTRARRCGWGEAKVHCSCPSSFRLLVLKLTLKACMPR